MSPPDLPPGVTIPRLRQMLDDLEADLKHVVECDDCGAGVDASNLAFASPDELTFLRAVVDYYDERR